MHKRLVLSVERHGRKSCLVLKFPRLPAGVGKQGLRAFRLQSAGRSQRKPLLPANASEHINERRRANAQPEASRTSNPHR